MHPLVVLFCCAFAAVGALVAVTAIAEWWATGATAPHLLPFLALTAAFLGASLLAPGAEVRKATRMLRDLFEAEPVGLDTSTRTSAG
jgi:hypothetical protein